MTHNLAPGAARPCPFCGSQRLRYRDDASHGNVVCRDCAAQGPWFGTEIDQLAPEEIKAAAIAAWNQRVKASQR